MTGLEGLLSGRLLGERYRIEEVIGRGGMGAVYRATDERLGREVALKVITVAGGADPESRDRLRARFHREARAAAALPHHPNVVPVYDYGSDPTLHLDYIVMELLRGHDLATRLARTGPPPLASGIRILYEAARGVAVGHRSGLIHRDVKPGNIFLAEAEHNEVQVRVVDFGIAKLADEDESLAQLTQDGRVPHSPAFASPEQLRGLSNLSPASDVFSLGAVGYTLLTGQRPFSESDRNRMALGMPVPAPSLRTGNPAIPSGIEAIVQKALAFEPADRYANADEMAREVAVAMRSLSDVPLEPYAAGQIPTRPSDARDDERTRVLDTSAAYPAGADATRAMEPPDDRTLLAPPSSAAHERHPSGAPPTRAFPRRESRKRRRGGAFVWLLVLLALSAAAYAIFTEMSEAPPPPRVVTRDSIPPAPDTLPTITPETTVPDSIGGGQPELQAVVLNAEGLANFRRRDYAAAAENFGLAADLVPGNPDYAYNYGQTLMRLGRPADAARYLARTARLDPSRTGAHYNLGLAYLMLGDTAAAWSSLQRAHELAETPAERTAAFRQIQAIERAQFDFPRPNPDTAGAATDSLPVVRFGPATGPEPIDTFRIQPAPDRPGAIPYP
jgi:serine/threonine protein kinase